MGPALLRKILFSTRLGPMGSLESEWGIAALRVGYASIEEIDLELDRIAERLNIEAVEASTDESRVAESLRRYAEGDRIDFGEVELDDERLTDFARRVTEAARQIPFGEKISYAELARRAGSPGAFRAAGGVMAKNRWPIVVPCHRVVQTSGKIGGFSVPEGIAFKEKLLALESAGFGQRLAIAIHD